MTEEEYWQSLVAKTPQLADESAAMRIVVAKFKIVVLRAYRQGRADGSDSKRSFESLFGGLGR